MKGLPGLAIRPHLISGHLQVPSPATLSRCRLQLDILLMSLRQTMFSKLFFADPLAPSSGTGPGCFIFLSADASSLRGTDHFMCLECVSASVVGSIIDATVEEREAFSDASHVKTQILPPAVIGYGNSNVGAKVEAMFHSCKLDVGASGERLQMYSQSCLGFCSDFGTESGLMDVPALNISDLLSSTWCRSRLLSKP